MNLAQFNIARMRGALESPVMKDFRENLDKINALAESSAGFIWRLKDGDNNATSFRPFDDEYILVNMSVWRDHHSLIRYVYHTTHKDFLRLRKKWFIPIKGPHVVLWYLPPDKLPDLDQAVNRLNYLKDFGETPYAFTFRKLLSFEQAKKFQPEGPFT